MKSIFNFLASIYTLTAIIVHLWTVYIAFTVSGLIAGVISLFLPIIAEIYWVYKMLGHNQDYVTVAIVHLVLAIPYLLFKRDRY